MGQKKTISELECLVAKEILTHLKKTSVTSAQLAGILKITITRAGFILRRLGWTQEITPKRSTPRKWGEKGADKQFRNQRRSLVILRAARVGIKLE